MNPREVKLRITRDIQVSLPGNRSYTLPPGVHVGYIDEAPSNRNAMLCLDDTALIKKLGLNEQARPINFEVLRHITSGAIEVDED